MNESELYKELIQPHLQGRFHASASGMGFLFGHCCLERQRHLGVIVQGEDSF